MKTPTEDTPVSERKWTGTATKFGEPSRVSDSDSRLIAYALDEDGDESIHLFVKCAMVDPAEELATIRAVTDLCNGREEIVKALLTAYRVIDSVAFVKFEGDKDYPLKLIRAALSAAEGWV